MMLRILLNQCRRAVTLQNELNLHANALKLRYVDALPVDINK